MMETLREVAPNLWVSDIESAAIVGEDFSLVIDCTGHGPTVGNGKTASLRPTGKTNHMWTEQDLNTITCVAGLRLEAGGDVLIHCNRGVSRSVCAAAATILWLGLADSVEAALEMVRYEGRAPASQSVGGLKKWWSATKQPGLFD